MFANAKAQQHASSDFKVLKLSDPPRHVPAPHGRYDISRGAQFASEHQQMLAGLHDAAHDDASFEQRKKLIDDEAAQDGSKRMVPEYFANLSDPNNPHNRKVAFPINSVGGIGRDPSPHKLRDYYTDVCNQKTDPKYIKPERKFKADEQIDKYGHVISGEYGDHATIRGAQAESLDKEGIAARLASDITDPFSLRELQNPSPRRYGKAICKAKLDEIVADESPDRPAGLRSEKVSETDERVVYEQYPDPIKWDGVPVDPILQRHRGYAQGTVQRSLALQEVGCEFPISPQRHRCLEGSTGHADKKGKLFQMSRGDTQTLEGFRRLSHRAGREEHHVFEAERELRKSHFVIG
jgi:hypothetical protein